MTILSIIPSTKIFPTIMIVCMGVASLFYFVKGDVKHGIYWACSCLINITVTF